MRSETKPCSHPRCPEEMQYIPAAKPEPDTNFAGHEGGWSCPAGHFDENGPRDDEPSLEDIHRLGDQARRTGGSTIETLNKWGDL